jgi:hypothetical protein
MYLIKDPSNDDRLKSDLDTIQRTIGQLQQAIVLANTNIAALQVKTANPAAPSIGVNGGVSNIVTGVGLQTVAHDGTMTGKGTPASPLSALQGTPSPVFVTSLQLQNNQIAGLATTPKQIVAGVTGKIPILLTAAFIAQKPAGAGWTNGGTGWSVEWATDAGTSLMGATVGLNLNGGASKVWAIKPGNQTLIGAANDTGTAMQVRTAADITAGTGSTPTNVWIYVFYSFQNALF